MKKLLISLSSIMIVGTTASSVVACGPVTFSKLMNRKNDTSVYKGTFKAPTSNWSTAVTMQHEDSVILSNLNSTLLTADQYNNFQGDLADKWGHNTDSTSYYFHMRTPESEAIYGSKSPKWYDYNGNAVDDIKPSHLFNAFRYVFNPNNGSEVTSSWDAIIDGGLDLVNSLDQILDSSSDEYDARFDKDANVDGSSSSIEGNAARANTYIDAYIMAYNISQDLETARALAISSARSEDGLNELKLSSMTNGKMIKAFDDSTFITSDDIVNNDVEYNLQINLSNPTPYFEGVIAFLAWAPLPDIAVEYYKNYLFSGYNYGKNYQSIYTSGPYIVQDYSPTQTITLTKNKDYWNVENVYIDKLIYSYIGTADVSRPRLLFESNDISEVTISPTDFAGWNKYVGEDANNPKFDGAHNVEKLNGTTYGFLYNVFNTSDWNGQSNDDINKAIVLNSVRQYLAYNMDRNSIAKYYSSAMDGNSSQSSLLRNTYTSKNTAKVESESNGQTVQYDYAAYINALYSGEYKSFVDAADLDLVNSPLTTSSDNGQFLNEILNLIGLNGNQEFIEEWIDTFGDLGDGKEVYLDNDITGVQTFFEMDENGNQFISNSTTDLFNEFVQYIGDYSEEALTKKYDLISDKVQTDLKAIGINSGQINLPILTNGASETTVNLKIRDAYQDFNNSSRDLNRGINSTSYNPNTQPILISERRTTDQSDFLAQRRLGTYSILIAGWSPDFADASNYLDTIAYGGSYDPYQGLSKVLDRNFEYLDSAMYDNTLFNDFKNRNSAFNVQLKNAEDIGVWNIRNEELAKAEIIAIQQSQFFLPIYLPSADKQPSLSYVNSFTRATAATGSAQEQMIGVQLLSKLWTKAQYEVAHQEFENLRGTYKAKFPRGHNGFDYRDGSMDS